jgi:hypothetical protein
MRSLRTFLTLSFLAFFALIAPSISKDASEKKAAPDPAQQTTQQKDTCENLKFTLADREADKDQTISDIYATFWTNDDDKGVGDGISETYLLGDQVLAQNKSWSQAFKFKEHALVVGKQFDISSSKIPAHNVGALVYKMQMDNDDGWNVDVALYVRLANGHVYLVGNQYLKINATLRSASITPGW